MNPRNPGSAPHNSDHLPIGNANKSLSNRPRKPSIREQAYPELFDSSLRPPIAPLSPAPDPKPPLPDLLSPWPYPYPGGLKAYLIDKTMEYGQIYGQIPPSIEWVKVNRPGLWIRIEAAWRLLWPQKSLK